MEYHTISTQFRMKYYVYQLRAINSEIPFYIGKGTDGRSKEHVAQARKGNMTLPQYVEIQRLWQIGIAVIDEVLFCTFSEQLAYDVERSYINLYVGQILNRRQVAEDYHPKRINKPIFEYPRLLSHAPFPFHYVRHWRNKYRLHSIHEDIATKFGLTIDADPVRLITDDKCQLFDEVSFEKLVTD